VIWTRAVDFSRVMAGCEAACPVTLVLDFFSRMVPEAGFQVWLVILGKIFHDAIGR
jgi:hypothetical protein